MRDGDRRAGETADAQHAPGASTPGASTPDASTGSWASQHPFRPVIALIVLTVLGLLATAGFKSYRDLDTAASFERELLDEIADAEGRIQALDEHIDRIRNDPAMLERLAREDLGMVRAGDVVILLPEEPRTTPPRRADLRRTSSSASPAVPDSVTANTTDSPEPPAADALDP